MKKNSNIDMVQTKIRPLKDSNGNELSDYDLAVESLKKIDTFQQLNGQPAPISPKFISWLRNGVDFVNEGKGSFVDYKKNSILKELDYDLIISNTNKMNAQLEKKGAFNSKVVSQIKGVSK